MLLRLSALLLAVFASHAALAQNNTFELHLNGKKIGKDTFTISKAKQGYKISSHYSYSTLGYEGQYNAEYHFDDNYSLIDCGLDNTGTMLHYAYTPNKAMSAINISTMQVGSQSSEFVDIKPDFLPNFDPAAAQALLLHALTHPTPDNKYNVLIPSFHSAPSGGGGKGSAPAAAPTAAPAGDSLPPGNHAYEAVWIKGGPLTGTLAGRPIKIGTYALAFGNFRWIFFADEQNNLMQLNVTLIRASYIRSDFRLDPPKQAMPQ
jgi:hypothetical protein